MKAANDNNRPTYWIRDTIALLCILLLGWLMIVAGAAFGFNHCQRNHCAGYEQEAGQ